MSSYKELVQQRADLEKKISAARQNEMANAIASARALIDEYALTPQEVFPASRARSAASGTKVAPKYRDPATGQTWTGRGKAPKWIQNQDRSGFVI